MKANDAKRLKELEAETARLKKLVANQALDIDMLRDPANAAGAEWMSGAVILPAVTGIRVAQHLDQLRGSQLNRSLVTGTSW